MSRRATCQCGQLTARCEGEPVRVSVCHCLDCQRRSGSSFAAQARFPADRITIEGSSTSWSRTGDEGSTAVFHSCPVCSATVYYMSDAQPDLIAVPVGAFADPSFPAPDYSVYEVRKHAWVSITSVGTEHYD